MRRRVHEDEPVKPRVPMADCRKQSNRRQRRKRQRDEDAPQRGPVPGAVHERRLLQLLRQVAEEVEQQDDVEHWDRSWQHECPYRIHNAGILNDHVQRNESAAEHDRNDEYPNVYRTHPELLRLLGEGISD